MSTPSKKKRSNIQKRNDGRNETVKKRNLLSRSVPVYLFLLLTIIPICSLGLYFHFATQNAGNKKLSDGSEHQEVFVKVVRASDQSLVCPLLFVEIESEKVLDPLKIKIQNYLAQKKLENAFSSASVYIKDLNAGIYLNINPDSLYDPASLLKVPLLMVYLKQAGTRPDLLKKKLLFSKISNDTAEKIVPDKSLTRGVSYTVEELLHNMIVYSDNEAFWMLCDNIGDVDRKIKALDAELGIPEIYDTKNYAESEERFIASASSIAHYFNVLYNASYLNKEMSEYALDLLTKSNYKNGIVKHLDPGITVAHKFGERTRSSMLSGRQMEVQTEFHEFGIIYLKDRPYLLGVMTRGTQPEAQQTMIRDISSIVFDEFRIQ